MEKMTMAHADKPAPLIVYSADVDNAASQVEGVATTLAWNGQERNNKERK
jgi:hypothetical protein